MTASQENPLDWLVSKFARDILGWRTRCWCRSTVC